MYRTFVEATNAIVWTADESGRPTPIPQLAAEYRANRRGVARPARLGPVHPDDRATTAEKGAASAKAGQRILEAEFRPAAPRRQYVWMSARALLLNAMGARANGWV
jgi:hypothetical protein